MQNFCTLLRRSARACAGFLACFVWVAGALLPSNPCDAAVQAAPRQTLSFDEGWRFHLGDAVGADQSAFSDTSWQPVHLPHDYSIEGPVGSNPKNMDGPFDKFSPAGGGCAYLNAGTAWYRKTFSLPPSQHGKRLSLLFDGAYDHSEVWINGHSLGTHPYGFTSFFYDLTPYLKFGPSKNIVAVRLDTQQPSARWYPGSGLYRHVWLIATSPVHLAQWQTYITTPKATVTGAQVRVRTQVDNDGSAGAGATLVTTLFDPAGAVVGQQTAKQSITSGGHAAFDQTFPLRLARLWSCETPVLYRAVSQVRVGTTLSDSTTTSFGIRTIEFTKDNGFLLNGKRVQLNGVCNHADLGCLGSAALRRGLERQLQILKGMGCNAWRTSHNPPSPELLDLCDQMGFLVMDESFDEWTQSHTRYGPAHYFDEWSERDMMSMLDRDRNHPSIILWSIGNEIPEGRSGNPIAGPEAVRLAGFCHREDPTRPVTSACPSPDNDWKSGLGPALDVFGINYNIGYYSRNKPGAIPLSDPARYHGELPMFASETSSQVDSRGEYGLSVDAQGAVQIDPKPSFQVSCYDLYHPGWGATAEDDLLGLKNAPWVAGEFVWTGFDYLGEPTPYPWPARSSYFGIVDLCGFPKDRYYLYKSQWSKEPLVHLLPSSWTWPGFEGKPIPVRVFTNADTVELFLNGASLGVKTVATDAKQLHLEWSVPYAPGILKAVAKKNGQTVATDVEQTAGAPAQIMLSPDRAGIAGDGQDLSFIKVSVLDKAGIVCPNAANEIHFALQGAGAYIAGLDNGDATNHEFFQGTQHQVFHGLGLVVLRSNNGIAGPVTLTASGDGLTPVTTTVTVSKPAL